MSTTTLIIKSLFWAALVILAVHGAAELLIPKPPFRQDGFANLRPGSYKLIDGVDTFYVQVNDRMLSWKKGDWPWKETK